MLATYGSILDGQVNPLYNQFSKFCQKLITRRRRWAAAAAAATDVDFFGDDALRAAVVVVEAAARVAQLPGEVQRTREGFAGQTYDGHLDLKRRGLSLNLYPAQSHVQIDAALGGGQEALVAVVFQQMALKSWIKSWAGWQGNYSSSKEACRGQLAHVVNKNVHMRSLMKPPSDDQCSWYYENRIAS